MSNSHGTDAIENFRSDYDTRFTTDISKQMQMPDRLGAISTIYDSYMPPLDPLKDSKMPNLDMPHYLLDTPPRVLTLRDHPFASSDDEIGDLASDMDDALESGEHMNSYSTPRKGDCDLAEPDIDVPMTPGTMLLLQNGDEMAVIRRQVAKLSRHVARLQEDNSRRRNRELILYPVIVGYCLMQLVRMFLRSK